ncbi:MAG: NAD(+) synthase, partial [Mesorhizobium sp.]
MTVRPTQDAQTFLAQALAIDPAAETDRIVTALRNQLRGIRKRGLLLGLSGGIDSSVSVALAARAVGHQNVLCLFMPENDSDPESLVLGRLVADTFSVEAIVEDIGPILRAMGCYQRRDAFIRELVPEYGEGWASKIVIANALEGGGYNISSLVVQDPNGKQTKIRMPLQVYLGIVAATNMKQRTRKQIEYY